MFFSTRAVIDYRKNRKPFPTDGSFNCYFEPDQGALALGGMNTTHEVVKRAGKKTCLDILMASP
jgi:hypothetical protein